MPTHVIRGNDGQPHPATAVTLNAPVDGPLTVRLDPPTPAQIAEAVRLGAVVHLERDDEVYVTSARLIWAA